MLASVVIAAFLALTIYRQPGTYDLLDVLVVAAMPMVGVVLLTVLPVKTLAYGTLKIGAENISDFNASSANPFEQVELGVAMEIEQMQRFCDRGNGGDKNRLI